MWSRSWRANRSRRCTGSRCCVPGPVDPLVVGDRLDTDIEGATNAGVDSLLVLTGVATPIDVLTAAPRHRPTHLAADLSALHRPGPEVRQAGDTWSCDGWTARWDGARLTPRAAAESLSTGSARPAAAAWHGTPTRAPADEDALNWACDTSLEGGCAPPGIARSERP